nr:ATP-binding protein [Cohnella sp. CFH 77786]
MVHYADFSSSVKDFRKFLEYDLKQLASRDEPIGDKLTVVFRHLHTFKGTFAQWGLRQITERLHEAETLVSKLGKREPSEAMEWLDELEDMSLETALEEDMQMLRDTVGDEFLQDRDVLMIDKARLIEIEKKMLQTLSPVDCKLLLPDLRKLRYKPFRDLLKTYPEYVEGLASRLEKSVNRFDIRGGDFLADTDKYGELGRSLIHIFRNAVDHGIETAEEREASGKEVSANLICDVSRGADSILLSIADDGKGIDVSAIKARAQAAGIYAEDRLANLDDREALDLIFRDELSTKEQVTELSGRGIGLSSVKAEVLRLGGTIEVMTGPGQGTIFRITLPADELTDLPQLGVPTVIEPLVRTTETFFREQAGVRLVADEMVQLQQGKNDKLLLNKVTTFIHVKGAVEGIFVMTADDRLSRILLQRMVIGGIPEAEEDAFVEDSLAEAANTVLGNSLSQLQSLEEFILMDPPITIRTEGASIRYADSEIWTCRLDSGQGVLRVGFVILKKSSLT